MIAVYRHKTGGRCWIGGKKFKWPCTRKARFHVCSYDGKPYTSRHEGDVCPDHLLPIITKLCNEGHDWQQKP